MGLPNKSNENKDALISRIATAIDPVKPNHNAGQKPVFEKHFTPKEDVIEMAKKFADKGMELRFPDDNTWQVRCKGAMDTGTLHQSKASIAKCIDHVSKGARNPRGLKMGDKIMFTA